MSDNDRVGIYPLLGLIHFRFLQVVEVTNQYGRFFPRPLIFIYLDAHFIETAALQRHVFSPFPPRSGLFLCCEPAPDDDFLSVVMIRR